MKKILNFKIAKFLKTKNFKVEIKKYPLTSRDSFYNTFSENKPDNPDLKSKPDNLQIFP